MAAGRPDKKMNRRDLTWLMARITASAAGQSFFPCWLAASEVHSTHGGRPNEPDLWTNYKPQFFSTEEFSVLDQFTAMLIPTDDTPGAREAHVAPFIDFVVFSSSEYAPETQAHWRDAVKWLIVHHVDEKLMANISIEGHDGHEVFQTIKQMAVYAFYTSRAGLIENLEYKGVSYLLEFPGCTHPEHHRV